MQVRRYAPLVFHHIRTIDNISIEDIRSSLDIINNVNKLSDSFASGGRSGNPILFTWNKKFLIKTISFEEKNTLLKMLPEYHRKMRDYDSLLCRIYGIFRITVQDKKTTHIILMKNMCELPPEVKIFLILKD